MLADLPPLTSEEIDALRRACSEHNGLVRGWLDRLIDEHARRRSDAWQPIETAPRDGRLLLLGKPGAAPWLGWLLDGQPCSEALRWRPLPEPPP